MKLSVFPMLCAFALFAAGGAHADPWKDESGKGRKDDRSHAAQDWKDKKRDKDDGRGSYFHDHGYTRLSIPPGHYPPPGECRVWYPDRPPGHQPPPGKCSPVPLGAWVIHHPHDLPGHVHVSVYEPHAPGEVLVVGEFEIASGVLVRVILQ